MEHKYAEVNGVKLHYVCSGSGKLMLFLHGFPEFWYEWKNQLAEFGQDHFAVAPDMRGYNLSDKPESLADYQVDVLVDDVKALADHLGYEKLTLIAHDWGGAIAWVFALKYPNYLDKLVIINAPHPIVFQRELIENPAQQEASQYMLVFRSEQAEGILSSENYAPLVQNTLSEGLEKGFFTEEDKQAYLAAWSQPGALTGGLNYYRAAEVGPPTNEEDKSRLTAFSANFPDPIIQVPTLVIWGEKDPYLLLGNLEGLSDYVPNLTIKRIEDGSHWVVHEQPKLVNQYIREFI
ncbi:MAG: alpha/beta hydrolase [Blastocatellia bacterium]